MLIRVLWTAWAATAVSWGAAGAARDGDVVEGQFLVTLWPNITEERFVLLSERFAAEAPVDVDPQLEEEGYADATRVRVRVGVGAAAFYKGYRVAVRGGEADVWRILQDDLPFVQYVEPNHVVSAESFETEEEEEEEEVHPKCLAVQDETHGAWGLGRLTAGASEAPDRNAPYRHHPSWGAGVDAYIVDSGVDCSHQELKGRCTLGHTNVPGTTPEDEDGHGTHVAGTVAGKNTGVAKQAHIVAVRVLNRFGRGTDSGIVAGAEWAANQTLLSGKSSVINMSLKIYGRAIHGVMEAASRFGAVFTISAGNTNSNLCSNPSRHYPRHALVVAASDLRRTSGGYEDYKADFSSYGACVDIIAPGAKINSAVPVGKYATCSGTSMAAPHVAGAAAVYLGQRGSKGSVQEVTEWILGNALEGVVKGFSKETPNLFLQIPFYLDGFKIVLGSFGTVKVWDGTNLMTLEGHTDWVRSVAVTPDGSKIVSGSEDNTVKVWDMVTGENLQTFKGHRWVNSVAVTPDGSKIVSGSEDRIVKVWDMVTGENLHMLKGHRDWVMSVAVTPDGSKIVSGSHDGTVKVWDMVTGENLQTLKGDPVESVAVTPDGSKIVSGTYFDTVDVWYMVTGRNLQTLEGGVRCVAVTPDGSKIVSGYWDKTVKVWDMVTGEKLQTLKGHTASVRSVAVTPDGSKIVSGSADKTVKVWDMVTGESLQTLQESAEVSSVAITLAVD